MHKAPRMQDDGMLSCIFFARLCPDIFPSAAILNLHKITKKVYTSTIIREIFGCLFSTFNVVYIF